MNYNKYKNKVADITPQNNTQFKLVQASWQTKYSQWMSSNWRRRDIRSAHIITLIKWIAIVMCSLCLINTY